MKLVFRSIQIITVSSHPTSLPPKNSRRNLPSHLIPLISWHCQSVPTTAASDISAFPFPLYSELIIKHFLLSSAMLNMYDFLWVLA
ncbi:hypothetical protein PILCRDRAFT_606175 [Piloderma croceum F 1598]|uniref:Uncharacterized protein n=1 Tax=Piloderma croceum (strain F 1598) TaxID=765440 RepID=A0A0C3AVC7_PILCF|nr:hypothetical protein PILCRDRAFT_606175 [Piloderma croceum F 1598]